MEVDDSARGIVGVGVRPSSTTTGGDPISFVWDEQLLVIHGEAPSGNGCSQPWYDISLPNGLAHLNGWVCGEFLHKK
jgi:hypothetical protein